MARMRRHLVRSTACWRNRMRSLTTIVAAVAALAGALCAEATPAAADDANIVVLARHGIQPTADSIARYLESLHPDGESKARFAKLIRQLGDEDFFRREEASAALRREPLVSVELLEKASRSADPEVRWRATQVLATAEQTFEAVLLAALHTVTKQEINGLAKPILRTFPLCKKSQLRAAAVDAFAATVTAEDTPLLRQQLKAKDADIRVASVTAISAALGEDAIEDLLPLLGDEDERVALAAARALANAGGRQSLATLVHLLEAESIDVRIMAVGALRELTGQHFCYLAYDPPENRAAAVAQWKKWIAGPGRNAPLKYPIEDIAYELGRTLYCQYGTGKVYELDASREKIVWQKELGQNPWACLGLPNGHRVIALYSGRVVVEFDRTGTEIWRSSYLPGGPMSVQRLADGQFLAACTDSGQVVQVGNDKKITWTITLAGRPVDARRLDSGRTLVALQNGGKVVEVDRSGKIVWEITGLSNPMSAQRLGNGNTLVCCMGAGRVIEFGPDKSEVWSKGGLSNPYQAQRLSNGNTLITEASGLIEVDSDGNKVWHKTVSGISRSHRF